MRKCVSIWSRDWRMLNLALNSFHDDLNMFWQLPTSCHPSKNVVFQRRNCLNNPSLLLVNTQSPSHQDSLSREPAVILSIAKELSFSTIVFFTERIKPAAQICSVDITITITIMFTFIFAGLQLVFQWRRKNYDTVATQVVWGADMVHILILHFT